MAITFTGTGGLFTRLGRLLHGIQSANLYLGSTDISAGGLKAVGVTATDVLAQYQSALQQVPDGIMTDRDTVRTVLSSWKQRLQAIAENTVIEMAHADVTLIVKDLETALKELIKQMYEPGTLYAPTDDVDASTVSATVTAASGNTGTGVLVASIVRPDGRDNELVFAETIEALCTTDSQAGGTARQETFTVRGEPAVSDSLAFDWPGGSGASTTLTAIDASQDASGNLLYGTDFDTFTTVNQPDYFGSALVGAYGTDIFETSSVVYRSGGKALEFRGTGGAPLSSIAQKFNVSSPAAGTSGTSSALKANTVYAVNFFARRTTGLAAGAIQIRLLDQAGSPAVVNDDAGTANTITVTAATLTTSYAAYNGFFRTPKLLPSTGAQLNVRVSTALTSGESVYIDDLAMCEATELYTSGVYAAIFAGATNWLLNDLVTVAVANNRAGAFQEWFDRVFDMRGKGLQLPSDTGGTETIVDTLIA